MIVSPYETTDILESAMNRNYQLIQKGITVWQFHTEVVLDERFVAQVKQAQRNIDTLRIMGNKYYEKNSVKEDS